MEYLEFYNHEYLYCLTQTSPESVKEYKTSTKTEEELINFTLDENLSEKERLLLIIFQGQFIQKIAIFRRLAKILSDQELRNECLPKILDDLIYQNDEIITEMGFQLEEIIKKENLIQIHEDKFYKLFINFLKKPNKNILESWLFGFGILLKNKSDEEIENGLIPIILKTLEKTETTSNRCFATKIIGLLAKNIIKNILDKIVKLCQDFENEIRKNLVDEVLYNVCGLLEKDEVEIIIFPKIMELIYDGDLSVKTSAIHLIFQISYFLSEECVKTRLCSVFLEVFSSHNEELLKRLTPFIGEILCKIESFMPKSSSFYSSTEFAQHTDPNIRKNLASNFDIILKIEPNIFIENFKQIFFQIINYDSIIEIRYEVIRSFGALIKLGRLKISEKILRKTIINLINDQNILIVYCCINYSLSIFQNLANNDTEEEREGIQYKELSIELFNLIQRIHNKNNWRISQKLLESIRILFESGSFGIKLCNEKYISILEFSMKEGNSQIRKTACENLLSIQKISPALKQRADILKLLQNEFLKSKNYFRRLLFLEYSLLCLNKFTRKYLCVYIIPDCLRFSSDKVSNIRRKLAESMVLFRQKIRPHDKENLNLFEETLNILKKDINTDVNEAIYKSIHEINKINFNSLQFERDCEIFDFERQKEEDNLNFIELKDLEEKKENGDKVNKLDFKGNKKNKFLMKGSGSPKCFAPKLINEKKNSFKVKGEIEKSKLFNKNYIDKDLSSFTMANEELKNCKPPKYKSKI